MSDNPTIDDLLAADPRDPGCSAAFDVLDRYVDLELAGKDAAGRFPGFAAHLRGCLACRAEHDGLLATAQAERSGDISA
jgi:hypothetical protein